MTSARLVLALLLALVLVEAVTGLRGTRALIREVATFFVHFELLALRCVRFLYPPRFVITGRCQMRGVCCTMIVGDPPRWVKRRPLLLGFFAGYHRVLHDFTVVDRGPEGELIFSCGHLQSDGRCGIYRHRPFICRNYPVLPWFAPPRPLPGCNFGVAPRVVARMQRRAALPIVGSTVAVHHPTRPGGRQREELPEDFVRVDFDP